MYLSLCRWSLGNWESIPPGQPRETRLSLLSSNPLVETIWPIQVSPVQFVVYRNEVIFVDKFVHFIVVLLVIMSVGVGGFVATLMNRFKYSSISYIQGDIDTLENG